MADDPGPELPGRDARPLSPDEAARWAAKADAVDQFVEALAAGDVDQAEEALDRMRRVEVDLAASLDALRLPPDAGEFAPDLEEILRRIPSGWGRWIRCGPGWYPVLARLNAALAALDTGYYVFQVKEKFGGLRYYFGASDPQCCARWDAVHPAPDQNDQAAVAEHEREWVDHAASPEHEAEMGRRSEFVRLAHLLVHEAEVAAGRTCELTGGPGVLMVAGTGCLRTLDPAAAPDAYAEIEPPVIRDNLRELVERAGDNEAELRRLIWLMQDELEHLTTIAQGLLDALRTARPEPGLGTG